MSGSESRTDVPDDNASFLQRAERDPLIKRLYKLHQTEVFVDFGEERYVAKQGKVLLGRFHSYLLAKLKQFPFLFLRKPYPILYIRGS